MVEFTTQIEAEYTVLFIKIMTSPLIYMSYPLKLEVTGKEKGSKKMDN